MCMKEPMWRLPQIGISKEQVLKQQLSHVLILSIHRIIIRVHNQLTICVIRCESENELCTCDFSSKFHHRRTMRLFSKVFTSKVTLQTPLWKIYTEKPSI